MKNWETIFTVGDEITWFMNHKTFEEGQEPTYKAYRFFGDELKSCLVGKVKLYGEMLYVPYGVGRNLQANTICDVQVLYDEVTPINLGNIVTYLDKSLSSLCESISPSYGSVKGGDIVTISGSNLSTEKGDYEIFFDGVKCEVQDSPTETEV